MSKKNLVIACIVSIVICILINIFVTKEKTYVMEFEYKTYEEQLLESYVEGFLKNGGTVEEVYEILGDELADYILKK